MGVFVGSAWSAERAKRANLPVKEVKCAFCGGPSDSIWHRAWTCTNDKAVNARDKAASQKLIAEARAAGEDNLLFSRAIVENPVLAAPLQREEDGVAIEYAEGVEPDVVPGGLAFIDGSCDRPPVKELCRAAWAVIFTDQSAIPVA